MTKVYTIDAIEGNSNLGVPVFSNFGKMTNFQYIVLSSKNHGDKKDEAKSTGDEDIMQFQIKKETYGSVKSQAVTVEEKQKELEKALKQIAKEGC